MELTYTQAGDYLIPNITIPETPCHLLGKYGRMRRTYLKEHRTTLWDRMILDGSLWSHLADVDRICCERMETLTEGMKRTRGITEELKAADQLRWVTEMNNICAAAEEIVLREVVYA